MAMTTNTPTRRAVIGALAVAPIAIAVPAAASSKLAWDAAVTGYHAAYARWDAANRAYHVVEGAYFACRPDRPKLTAQVEVDWDRFGKHVIDRDLSHTELDDPDLIVCDMGKLADLRRQLADYRAADAAAREKYDVATVEDAEAEARDKLTEALRQLVKTPAPDLAALAEKVAIVIAEYGDDAEWAVELLRDVTSLGGRA